MSDNTLFSIGLVFMAMLIAMLMYFSFTKIERCQEAGFNAVECKCLLDYEDVLCDTL